jgi:hypothetical protein
MTRTGKLILVCLWVISLQPWTSHCYDIPPGPGFTEPHKPNRRCDFVIDWESYARRLGFQLGNLAMATALIAFSFRKEIAA